MTTLKATKVRVQNYRNIEDSGWIEIEAVTCLVGKNESGKSAFLKAIHKSNPATPEAYEPQIEFPRQRFTAEFTKGADWLVCSVEFEIVDALKDELKEASGGIAPPKSVTYHTSYDGTDQVEFDPPYQLTPFNPLP